MRSFADPGFAFLQTAGIVFPVPILLLIPVREYILPRFFRRKHLHSLDPAPYEDEVGEPLRKMKKADIENDDLQETRVGRTGVQGHKQAAKGEPGIAADSNGNNFSSLA